MVPDEFSPQEAKDTIFFEAEAPDGFLNSLESKRVFDEERWQQLWDAVASLIRYYNGTLDVWTSYDLTRIVEGVQQSGQKLAGRPYNSLDEFERQVLEANSFLNEIIAGP